ncbi:patatin-like phospholipase family protein [Sandarakinorhabdus sp.]|uniref:patatin-like phospholipase family protein n=1 Tax=Sandarakinorhabdus sp. TaxID=1916663 RepID=UPI00286D84B1|nr:patatin-like phospholipase family protein [Sandarakinorhabdus sp.]
MKTLHDEIASYGQIVLVLQGGGALGAYQVGVYQALAEAGIAPDWVVGTSIGAINAALIAGGCASSALGRLSEFWKRIEHGRTIDSFIPAIFAATARNMMAITSGVPNFYRPNTPAFMNAKASLGAENAGYYSVTPLAETLADLVDFNQINTGPIRLTVGASNVRTSEMTYFDSRDMTLDLRHIMASGALPPAFPAVRIGEDLFWDGGILSNTPVEVVFDDNPRKNGMVFAVHLWNPHGDEPQTIGDVMNRLKDVQYSSRAASHIKRQRQLHKLRHIIAEMSALLPDEARASLKQRGLTGYGCTTRMHVIRLLAPALDHEDQAKDVDFSREGIRQRWEAGYRHTCETLEKAPWRDEVDPTEGFVLHEACAGKLVHTAAAD